MDYVYYGNDSKEGEEIVDKKVTTLITKDGKSGVVFGDVCEHKGEADDWILKRVEKNIASLGRSNITLKTDGEPALIRVQEKIIGQRSGQTMPATPPAYNPESNGVIEKGAQDVVGHVRCMKLALESRLGIEIPAAHPIME